MTIEYTALHSDHYRQQLLQVIDRMVQGDRAFSFRHHFADAWYDLNHPELLDPGSQMKVELPIRRADFPANLIDDSLEIRHLKLFLARKDGSSLEAKVKALTIRDMAGAVIAGTGADLTTVNGVLSTREGPGTRWAEDNPGVAMGFAGKNPVGTWSFAFEEAVGAPRIAEKFKSEITDILLVVTFSGQTPPWPA